MESASQIGQIANLPLFAGLSPRALESVTRAFEARPYPTGQTIFAEGSTCLGLYLVKFGRVKLLWSNTSRQQLLSLAGPGEPLDLVPLLDGGPHTCTARARGPVELYFADFSTAHELIWNTPELLAAIIRALGERLRFLSAQVTNLAYKDVRARVCQWLINEATQEGRQECNGIHLKRTLSQAELGALIGTGREVVWRALRKLEAEGLIALDRNEIVILQPERLSHLT